jgi:hypothetical protein
MCGKAARQLERVGTNRRGAGHTAAGVHLAVSKVRLFEVYHCRRRRDDVQRQMRVLFPSIRQYADVCS